MNGMRDDTRCESFEADLSAFLDGELDAASERSVRAHLKACGACAAALERLRSADAALRAIARAPAAGESARLASLARGLAARTERNRTRRRAPRRVRRWLAPFGAGSLAGGAAAAALLLLVPRIDAPQPHAPGAALSAVPAPGAIAAARARVAAQEGADAFADRGASAPPERAAPRMESSIDEPIEHLDLVERLAALSPAERAALESELARWQALAPEARARLRARAAGE